MKEENLFISRMTKIRESRVVDMRHHTGKHELAPAINSLMMRDSTFLGYREGKLKLAANVAALQDISFKS